METGIAKRHQDTVLNSIKEGVFTVDLKRRITSFNRAAEKITRVRSGEAVGRPCCEVFRANICENACALERTLATGQPMVNVTAHIVTESGRCIPIRLSTALLKDKDGTVVGGVETFQDLTQIEQLRKELESRYTFEDIIGRSPAMVSLFQVMPRIAESDSTVLIAGASGTGKELFARAIHNLSYRKHKPFLAVNCAALPDTLLESELFGYKGRRFYRRPAKINPGGLHSPRVAPFCWMKSETYLPQCRSGFCACCRKSGSKPLGSVHSVKVDVRVLAATNQNLDDLIREKRFRKDLFLPYPCGAVKAARSSA